jgi:uncharacterized protein
MYLDSSYIAKFYVNEPDSEPVRSLISTARQLTSSAWAMAEVVCAFHRHRREGSLNEPEFRRTLGAFIDHVDAGFWTLLPVDDRILRRMGLIILGLPSTVFLRAGDAVHLTTAQDAGEREIWTNDRHMLAAATHLGIRGRSA